MDIERENTTAKVQWMQGCPNKESSIFLKFEETMSENHISLSFDLEDEEHESMESKQFGGFQLKPRSSDQSKQINLLEVDSKLDLSTEQIERIFAAGEYFVGSKLG